MAHPMRSETHTKFEQFTKGWPASGFKRRTTELAVRKVVRDGITEVQVEITILEFKGPEERMYTHCGELTLTPEDRKSVV